MKELRVRVFSCVHACTFDCWCWSRAPPITAAQWMRSDLQRRLNRARAGQWTDQTWHVGMLTVLWHRWRDTQWKHGFWFLTDKHAVWTPDQTNQNSILQWSCGIFMSFCFWLSHCCWTNGQILWTFFLRRIKNLNYIELNWIELKLKLSWNSLLQLYN